MVDTVVVNSTTPSEDPNHAQAMIDKIDNANSVNPPQDGSQEPPKDDRPGWLPEKFKSPEDLAKAYEELQSKLGGKSTDNKEPSKDNTADNKTELAGYDPSQHQKTDADNTWEKETYGPALKEIFDKAGIKASVISDEYSKTGAIPEYAYEKLQAAGFSRAVVDSYLGGLNQKVSYQSEQATAEIKNSVGGEQGFNDMVEWAAANLSKAEIEAYNKAIDSGDKNVALLAVQGVYSRFQSARPAEPNLFKGATSASAGAEAYESIAQLQKDMATADYKTDPAFRAKVERKLANSNIL